MFSVLKGDLSECEKKRNEATADFVVGRFIPQCELDGKYSKIQCHSSTGYCWCVDENGVKKENTEIRGNDPTCDKGNIYFVLALLFHF